MLIDVFAVVNLGGVVDVIDDHASRVGSNVGFKTVIRRVVFFREGRCFVFGVISVITLWIAPSPTRRSDDGRIDQRALAHDHALFCEVIGHGIEKVADELLLVVALAKQCDRCMIHHRVRPTQANKFAEGDTVAQHRLVSGPRNC